MHKEDVFLKRLERAERADNSRLHLSSKYRIVGPIANGCFSSVFRARRIHDKVEVAIKIFRRSPEALATYDTEVNAYRCLKSVFVVSLLDSYADRQTAWLVLELGACTLRRRMRMLRDLRVVAALLKQLVYAVRFLHENQVAHRDIKPENVLVCRHDSLKLCDFGMAASCNGRLHTLCGTPYYMAPELFSGSKNGYEGTPVDVWAMGAVAYELLHEGRLAFQASSMRDLVSRIRRGAYTPIRSGLPKVFRRFVERCLVTVVARPSSKALPIPIVCGASNASNMRNKSPTRQNLTRHPRKPLGPSISRMSNA